MGLLFLLRDRPFNLKGGGGGGGYGFLFRSEFFYRTTQELEYLFFLSRKAQFFFQNLTLGYMTKTLNQIIFFSSPPPFKLNGRSLKQDIIHLIYQREISKSVTTRHVHYISLYLSTDIVLDG